MHPRVSVIALGVSDLGKSLRFYRDGLGFPVEVATPDIVFFRLNGSWLALYGRKELAEDAQVPGEGHGFPGFTLAHNVASREEVDAVLTEAVGAGATLVKPAQDVFWGGYSGYFADPDGYLWEVAFNPHRWMGPED